MQSITLNPILSKIEICFGGVSPSGPKNGFTTCYGIFYPMRYEYPSVGIIFDNGTGIHNVMSFMKKKKPAVVFVLQSHLHHDHTVGFRFNEYLLNKDFYQYAVPFLITHEMLMGLCQQFSRPNEARNLTIKFLSQFPQSYSNSHLDITIEPKNLPHGEDGSRGFLITKNGKKICIATDCELVHPDEQKSFVSWSKDADVIILDMQYDSDDYMCGWGHNNSTIVMKLLAEREKITTKKTRFFYVHREKHDEKDSNAFLLLQPHIPKGSTQEFTRDNLIVEI